MSGANFNRRQFLKGAGVTAAGLTFGMYHRKTWAANKSTTLRAGIAGLRGRGGYSISSCQADGDVQIIGLCDPDPTYLNPEVSGIPGSTGYLDIRDMIARNDIDAIFLATPTHHHALQTLWSLQSGKHVFCEKPVSHNIQEPVYMAGHSNYYQKLVQVGLQQRSDAAFTGPAADILANTYGTGAIQHIHAWWFSARASIGNVAPYTPTKAGSSNFWDLYQGAASLNQIARTDVHNSWHWMWDTGNGDLSNLGEHLLDTAHMFKFAGATDVAPQRVVSFGRRYNLSDAGETPNIQLSIMDYGDGVPILIENRGLSSSSYKGLSSAVLVQCANGYYLGWRGTGKIYDNSDVILHSYTGDSGTDNIANFLAAIRAGNYATGLAMLDCPLSKCTPANAGCLLGNASVRMGTDATIAQIHTVYDGFGDALARVNAIQTHLTGSPHNINLTTTPLQMGPWLTYNSGTNAVTAVDGSAAAGPVATANDFLTDANRSGSGLAYRASYSLPSSTVPVELSEFSAT